MPEQSTILDRVLVRQAESDQERRRWDEIIVREHYLHSSSMMGEQLRYIAEAEGEWIGLIGWSAATLSSAARRHWIGWTISQERQRLHLIVQNARFLIRGTEHIPNLASRILALNTSRLKEEWAEAYHHDVLVAETFVDPSLYRGVCYRAAGWHQVGVTRGHRRQHQGYEVHGQPKLLLMKELIAGGRQQLCENHHTDDRGAYLTMHEIALDGEDGLLSHLRSHLQDPRGWCGRSFQFITIIGIVAAGILTGRCTLDRISDWAQGLDQATLAQFFCPRGKDRRHKVPCSNTMRYLLKDIDPQKFEQAITLWLQRRGLHGNGPGLSIGSRVHPETGDHGRPCPWHMRWTRKSPRSRPFTTVCTNAVPLLVSP